MKHSICKKIASVICSVILLSAVMAPALAEPVVTSVPVTDGVYCVNCCKNSMVATGGTRTESTYVTVNSCAEFLTVHVHKITTTYATYMCSICGNWGERSIGKTYSCNAA